MRAVDSLLQEILMLYEQKLRYAPQTGLVPQIYKQRVRVSMNIYCKSAKTAAALHKGDETVELHGLYFLKIR